MATSVDSIVKDFEAKWEIPNRSEYRRFIKKQIDLNSDKEETLGLTFLFSCLNGDRDIVDSTDMSKRRINNLEYLVLLDVSYIYISHRKRTQFDNPALLETLIAFNIRHRKDDKRLDYKGAVNRVLQYDGIIKRYGQTTYESHVNRWHYYHEKKDLEELKQYVMGKKPIIDRQGHSHTITPEDLDTLHLLSGINILFKDEIKKVYSNPELTSLMGRFNGRNARNRNEFLNHEGALSRILEDPDVKGYLGDVDYKSHVRMSRGRKRRDVSIDISVYNEDQAITALASYVFGEKEIIYRETTKLRKVRKNHPEDLGLLGEYNIVGTKVQGEYNNPELYKLMRQFDLAHKKNTDFLDYNVALSNLFGTNRALEYFGINPSSEHVDYGNLK